MLAEIMAVKRPADAFSAIYRHYADDIVGYVGNQYWHALKGDGHVVQLLLLRVIDYILRIMAMFYCNIGEFALI